METTSAERRAAARGVRLAWAGVSATLALVLSVPAVADQGARRLAQAMEKALTANPQTFQYANLRNLPQGGIPAAGGGYLVRSRNTLSVHVMAADLEPGHAYTFWWIIYNRPDKCAQSPCALTDRTAARGATFYASGAVAAAGGTNVSFSTNSGGPPKGAPFNDTLPAAGLMQDRGFKAEVHIVLVDHGVPGLVADLNDEAVDGTWGYELTTPEPFGPKWVRGMVFRP